MAPSPLAASQLVGEDRISLGRCGQSSLGPALVDTSGPPFNYIGSRQGSSVVEQGTHKPLVGSSTLPSGTFANRARRYRILSPR